MISRTTSRLFYLLCGFFILLNAVALVQGYLWVNLLPAVLIGLFFLLFHLETALLLLAFLIPLSINVENIGSGLGISLPDEPLMILIMGMALFKFVINGEYDYKVFRHPLTIAIFVNTAWIFITSITSQLPLVSFKFLFSRLWYIVVFYFLGIMLFRKYANIPKYLWLYIIPFTAVIIFTLIKHRAQHFSKDYSYEIMQPFFIAHGVYAAAIAFFIPFLVLSLLFPKRFNIGTIGWFGIVFILAVFVAGLIYSYTRAAWISVFGTAVFVVPLLLRIKLKTLLFVSVTGIVLFLAFQNQIYYIMSKTEDKSSNDISVHLKSISNIKSDASNAERINRWMSALRMFEERPVLGFGPGTYMFVYAPYQLYNYHTVISTNFGDVGNAHSEYFGPLSESGVIGLLSLMVLLYIALSVGFRLFYYSKDPRTRILALAVMLGLVTYMIHGVMNNYIDSDKIGVLWWSSLAMLTALDLYHERNPEAGKTLPEGTA